MKAFKILFFISFFSYISCGGIARAGCKAVSKSAAKSGSRTALKSSDDILLQQRKLYDDLLKNNPKLYDDLLKKNPKLLTPRPGTLPGMLGTSSAEVSGTATAKSVVPNSSIELRVLNSSGSTVSTLSNTNSVFMKQYIQNQYRQEFVSIVDDVFANISKKQITSAKQLNKEILDAVKSKIGDNKSFAFDISKGKLTYNMELYGMSGTVNIVKSVKDGLIIGASGYYVTKELGKALKIKGKSIFENMFKGYVLNKKSKKPISNAKIKWIESNKITHTKEDGSFSLYASEEEEKNELSVVIQKDGFEIRKIDYKKEGEEVKIFVEIKESE